MKKKIFYWSPCLSPVGTVISTINSSISFSKYSQEFEVSILNTCGEWDKFRPEFKREKIQVIDIGPKYYKFLPKNGFIQSRLSYILIFLISFIKYMVCYLNRFIQCLGPIWFDHDRMIVCCTLCNIRILTHDYILCDYIRLKECICI